MSKILTQAIETQILHKNISSNYSFTINGVDYSSYVISYTFAFNKDFGSAACSIELHNPDGLFGSAGNNRIYVGDEISLTQSFDGDSTDWPGFFGYVDKLSINKSSTQQIITISALDILSSLQYIDIDLEVEADKVEIEDEILTPNFLPSPNETLAQIFDFANNSLADTPLPVITIRSQDDATQEDPQFDGFQIYYVDGQVKLGSPLNALDNYEVVARSYSFYPVGLYAEDILESLLTEADGYDKYLFKEATAQAVIDNHLTTDFNTEESSNTDTLVPNAISEEIVIRTLLTVAYDGSSGTVVVTSTSGFPAAGTASIAGDSFTYTSKDATHLYGVTGLLAHPVDSYVKYTATYSPGQVWYMKYSNLITDLVSGDFTIGGGASLQYFDKRFGRIILDGAISLISTVTCDVNYSFKTLQATGIEINKMSFRSKELANRFEAVKKLKGYLAPNYIIRTQGDNKIWSSYLYQKDVEDYTLNLVSAVNYLGDDDLYTRTKFFGQNNNPTNLMFEDGVDFITTGQAFKALATQSELTFDREEGNYYVYETPISNTGFIDTTEVTPVVYINGIPINNTLQQIVNAPVQVVVRTRTETETSGGGLGKEPEVTVKTYYDYDVYFSHSNIDISSDIIIYDAVGNVVYTISAGDSTGRTGVWTIGGGVRNTTIEGFSTASYKVFYSTGDLVIDNALAEFKISKALLPNHITAIVTATYEYVFTMTAVSGINNVIDGRPDTQTQTVFFAEPPTGYEYAILDLGAIYNIQTLEMSAGFFRPDNIRNFDVDMTLTLKYSTDNVTYNDISDKTHAFQLASGEKIAFEESDLGVGFQARYLKLVIEKLKKLDYQKGVWVLALSEVAAFNNIVLSSESKLTPTTQLTSAVVVESLDSSGVYPTTLNVVSTEGFTEPDSGDTATAYIDGEDSFTYTGLTATSFTGVEGLSSDHVSGERVSQLPASDTVLYDDFGLLTKIGDRLYKDTNVDPERLFSQEILDRLSRSWLKEFLKNHQRGQISLMFAPYLSVGQTISLTDPYEGYTNEKFFIESISCRNGYYDIVIAIYPN